LKHRPKTPPYFRNTALPRFLEGDAAAAANDNKNDNNNVEDTSNNNAEASSVSQSQPKRPQETTVRMLAAADEGGKRQELHGMLLLEQAQSVSGVRNVTPRVLCKRRPTLLLAATPRKPTAKNAGKSVVLDTINYLCRRSPGWLESVHQQRGRETTVGTEPRKN
jgi:hypothetical protein